MQKSKNAILHKNSKRQNTHAQPNQTPARSPTAYYWASAITSPHLFFTIYLIKSVTTRATMAATVVMTALVATALVRVVVMAVRSIIPTSTAVWRRLASSGLAARRRPMTSSMAAWRRSLALSAISVLAFAIFSLSASTLAVCFYCGSGAEPTSLRDGRKISAGEHVDEWSWRVPATGVVDACPVLLVDVWTRESWDLCVVTVVLRFNDIAHSGFFGVNVIRGGSLEIQ